MSKYIGKFCGVLVMIIGGIMLLSVGNNINKSYAYVPEITTTTIPTTTEVITTTTTKQTTKKVTTRQVSGGNYKITHYGPDCRGCSGITASGYNVRNTIWYHDSEYGQVRVVATSRSIPLYSIIKIYDYDSEDIIAIVLDRGVSGNVIDLLVESEKVSTKLGIRKNISIEILREGK